MDGSGNNGSEFFGQTFSSIAMSKRKFEFTKAYPPDYKVGDQVEFSVVPVHLRGYLKHAEEKAKVEEKKK